MNSFIISILFFSCFHFSLLSLFCRFIIMIVVYSLHALVIWFLMLRICDSLAFIVSLIQCIISFQERYALSLILK